jgi:polysaccharide deacetylase 2 family uncharacterized protein YibQ
MSGNDLIKPLGMSEPRRRRPVLRITAIVVLVAAVAGGVYAARNRLPFPHGPTATAVINAKPAIPPPPAAPPEPATLTDITPPAGPPPAPGGDVIIHDADAPPAPAPDTEIVIAPPKPAASPDADGNVVAFPRPDLIEASSYGPLPRISANGETPLAAYARPAGNVPSGAARIAIVVGGLGIDRDSTASAIAALPPDVTLAFAPYDRTMTADVATAHAAGHELLLQVPMEPLNYPAIDPGPNTLTVDASDDQNRGRLRWLLGRMAGYVGVVNYLGARFTADQQAMEPVLRELASRGLLYLDDGSSPRSATELAAGRAPFLRADAVLDASLTSDAIDAALANLVSIAKARGFAIATATAFPLSVKEIADFASSAAGKGVVLVPVTALLDSHS